LTTGFICRMRIWSLQFAADVLGINGWVTALKTLLAIRLGTRHPTWFLQQAHSL